jgi:probable addiction module antidote protein
MDRLHIASFRSGTNGTKQSGSQTSCVRVDRKWRFETVRSHFDPKLTSLTAFSSKGERRLQKRRALYSLVLPMGRSEHRGWIGSDPGMTNIRSLKISLNAALRTADVRAICAAISEAIRKSSNVSRLADDAGVDRTRLYRSFRSGQIGPGLDLTIKILNALGIRFVVEFVRQPKTSPRRFGPSRKSDVHPELGSNSRMVAQYLTRAFDTSEIAAIVAAFSDVLRAQENVMELAERTVRSRSSLYRAFTPPRVPSLSTVVSFLNALGLRLVVKPLPKRTVHGR